MALVAFHRKNLGVDDDLRELEHAAIAGDAAAEEKLLRAIVRIGQYTARYVSGDHEAVWSELVELGPGVRDPEHLEDARAVARETMRRVRKDLEIIVPRLEKVGYEIQDPEYPEDVRGRADEQILIPPEEDASERIDALEALLGGPLPLSLRAFYEVVGSVWLCQDDEQISEDDTGSEVEELGTQDPLWVKPLGLFAREADWRVKNPRQSRLERLPASFSLSGDALQKAGVSGGNYRVTLPDRAADFAYAANELFVSHLREALIRGGFRQASPDSKLVRKLAWGLTPM